MLRINYKILPRRILETKPERRRKVGRQRARWLDRVEEDLRQLGIKQWRLKALKEKDRQFY